MYFLWKKADCIWILSLKYFINFISNEVFYQLMCSFACKEPFCIFWWLKCKTASTKKDFTQYLSRDHNTLGDTDRKIKSIYLQLYQREWNQAYAHQKHAGVSKETAHGNLLTIVQVYQKQLFLMLLSKWCFIFVSFSYLLSKHCFIIKHCFDANSFQNNVSSLVLNSHLSHYHWKWIKSRRTKPTNKFLPPFWIPFCTPKGGGGAILKSCVWRICQHLPWQNKIIS